MIRVSLRAGDAVRKIEFDPDSVKWKKQASQFAVGVKTGLPSPEKMFVKRGERAAAHLLWMKCFTGDARLPGAPEPLGYARDAAGEYHYYFSENLPPEYATLEQLLKRVPITDPKALKRWLETLLIEKNLAQKIAGTSAGLFQAMNRFGFAYTDFCAKNVMVDRKEYSCKLIDVDSAMPITELPSTAAGMQGLARQFSLSYWYAFHSAIGCFTPIALSQSMVLSFVAVWSRGLAMLQTNGDPLDVLKLLRQPKEEDQRPFWDALIKDDRAAFGSYFSLDDQAVIQTLFSKWKEAFIAMKAQSARSCDFGQVEERTLNA
jgi:hypothetical protein